MSEARGEISNQTVDFIVIQSDVHAPELKGTEMLVKDFKRDFYDAIQHQVRNNIEMRKRLHSYCLINYASFTFVCKHKISSRKKCRLLHTVEISERRGRIKTFDSDVTFHYVVKMIFFSIIS